MFGDVEDGRIIYWYRRNGPLLANQVKEAYDRAQCTIVPGEKEGEFVF